MIFSFNKRKIFHLRSVKTYPKVRGKTREYFEKELENKTPLQVYLGEKSKLIKEDIERGALGDSYTSKTFQRIKENVSQRCMTL